jgi:hypothetical protein
MRDVSARVRQLLRSSSFSASLSFFPQSITSFNFELELYPIVARIHALSEYTPICSSCGLILCALQPPYRPCPHCSAPLLTPSARAALLAQLEELRAHLLKEEAEAREREAEELRVAEGAFPVLSVSGSGPGRAGGAAGGGFGVGRGARGGAGGLGLGHRVLLVDSRTKRVKVESYSRSGLESEEEDAGEAEAEAGIDERVPPPAREVECVRVRRGPATRWVDLKGDETVAPGSFILLN